MIHGMHLVPSDALLSASSRLKECERLLQLADEFALKFIGKVDKKAARSVETYNDLSVLRKEIELYFKDSR